jgi:uncharacterized protein
MLRLTDLKLDLDHAEGEIKAALLKRLDLKPQDLLGYSVHRRAVDARKRSAIALTYTLDIEVRNEAALLKRLARDRNVAPAPDEGYRLKARAPAAPASRPVVIGTGPCGLFAGLVLAQMGFRPLILERGKNVQFGEGGAGTFSDGKLYSQIKDPHHYGRKVLTEFVKAGAPSEILTVAKPHIGTFRLVTIVEQIRATVEALGGEYRFQSKVEDIEIDVRADGTRQVRGVVLADGIHIATEHVVLAIGHSARDTFQMLFDHGVAIEAKPFSIGARIEHPQSLIDRCRYGERAGHPLLGAADYKLVHHCSNGRSVYSFCMCPGGTVVAAASEPGRVVTNGMSQYSRNERNANAGIVVGITPADYAAPAQRVGDFLARRGSTALGEVVPSYRPRVRPADLAACLPDFAVAAIREALPAFERQIKGFALADAVLTGVETRTSSPIRIRRDESFQSVNTRGLYPAGEGAGYAGGILSAGIDGIRIAEAVAASMVGTQVVQNS